MQRHKLFQRAESLGRAACHPGGPMNETALFSRAMLVRNIAGLPFPTKLRHAEAVQLRQLLESLLKRRGALKKALFAKIQELDNAELRLLGEIMFSGGFYPEKIPSMSFAAQDGTAALINFREHLALFAFSPGLSPEEAAAEALEAEAGLSRLLNFANDSQFGFLASEVSLTGSGMRLDCLLHLGALHRSGRLDAALRHLTAQGLSWKALGGDGSDITGDFYLIYGPAPIGAEPHEAAAKLTEAARFLTLGEHQAADWLYRAENRAAAEDAAFRAWALLSQARLMSYEETLSHLSTLKSASHRLPGLDCPPQNELNRLVLICQPGHIAISEGKKRLSPAERDEKRARLLRQALSKQAHNN